MFNRGRALNALYALDPGSNRMTWLRIGIAAKAAGLALDDFIEWSSYAANYGGVKDCRNAWEGADVNGRVTERTLFRMAHDAGWRPSRYG